MATRKRKRRKSKRSARLHEGAILRKLTRTGQITWDDPEMQKKMEKGKISNIVTERIYQDL